MLKTRLTRLGKRGLITKTGRSRPTLVLLLTLVYLFIDFTPLLFERALAHGRFGPHAILAQSLVRI